MVERLSNQGLAFRKELRTINFRMVVTLFGGHFSFKNLAKGIMT